jgi:hypothetical protein
LNVPRNGRPKHALGVSKSEELFVMGH